MVESIAKLETRTDRVGRKFYRMPALPELYRTCMCKSILTSCMLLLLESSLQTYRDSLAAKGRHRRFYQLRWRIVSSDIRRFVLSLGLRHAAQALARKPERHRSMKPEPHSIVSYPNSSSSTCPPFVPFFPFTNSLTRLTARRAFDLIFFSVDSG